MAHPFWTYSAEVMAFSLGPERPAEDAVGGLDARRLQILRAATRPGVGAVVLLGLGDGRLAAGLAGLAEPGRPLAVVELDPARARRLIGEGRLTWLAPDGPAQLVTDASPYALAFLLRLAGCLGHAPLVLNNPESGSGAKEAYGPLRRLLAARAGLAVRPAGRPRLSLGAILRPDEPGLPGFLAQAAGLADDLALVWDAPELPPQARLAEIPAGTVQLARPLGDDFAAQRNLMLEACPGPAVLSLDADERASDGLRRALPALAGLEGHDGVYLPRITPVAGDDGGERVLCGYGLWPDLQLRLFRKLPGASYVRPVHERLEGLPGPVAIAPAAPIVHLSHLTKSEAAWADKLARFDAASGGRAAHRKAADYPSLPLAFFEDLVRSTPPETLWVDLPGASPVLSG